MTFKYLEFTPEIFRPVIPVMLKSPARFMIYAALIDSGADYCIFGLDVADALEIKPNSEKAKFLGAGNELIEGFWGVVEIRIGGTTYGTRVIFADISDFGHGILGQIGFFNQFDVRLNYKNLLIDINHV